MNVTPSNELTLTDALKSHQIELPPEQIEHLDQYCRLLWQVNEKLNLTRHTDYETFVGRDLVDSLQLAALIEESETVLDVGSGGGVPGIVLAILRPDLSVSLCESVGKKAQALNEMVSELNLPVSVCGARVEDVLQDFSFDVLVARAVGPLWKILKWLEPHWPSVGRLLAVKGPRWTEERGEARHRGLLRSLELRRAASYPMPDTDSESVVLKVSPKVKKQ